MKKPIMKNIAKLFGALIFPYITYMLISPVSLPIAFVYSLVALIFSVNVMYRTAMMELIVGQNDELSKEIKRLNGIKEDPIDKTARYLTREPDFETVHGHMTDTIGKAINDAREQALKDMHWTLDEYIAAGAKLIDSQRANNVLQKKWYQFWKKQ